MRYKILAARPVRIDGRDYAGDELIAEIDSPIPAKDLAALLYFGGATAVSASVEQLSSIDPSTESPSDPAPKRKRSK